MIFLIIPGGLQAIFATLGIPASTTHAITGTIMGSGAARRTRAVRWNVGRQIVFAWIIPFLEVLLWALDLLI